MKKLFFIRHGQSEMNVKKLYAGLTDTPLTEEGRQQAKKAGQNAKDLEIDLIIASPLRRAHETAKIIAREIGYPEKDIQLLDDLKERDYGAWEGTSYTVEKSQHINQLDVRHNIEGLEQVDELLERAARVIEHSIKHPSKAKHVLLVGHGNIGRALRYHVVPEADFQAAFPNAELVRWI